MTSPFQWRSDYRLGFDAIDTQHKRLIAIINDLHVAMIAGKGKDSLARIFDELIRYTSEHFSAEEAFMRTQGYPGRQEHAEQHRLLTGQVLHLRGEFERNKIALTNEVMTFLKNWLTAHILGSDMQYAAYVKSKQLVRR